MGSLSRQHSGTHWSHTNEHVVALSLNVVRVYNISSLLNQQRKRKHHTRVRVVRNFVGLILMESKPTEGLAFIGGYGIPETESSEGPPLGKSWILDFL